MKPSINKLNGRLHSDPTINFYKSLCTDHSKWSDEWRHKRFKYKWNDGTTIEVTPIGNYIYTAAHKEFVRIARLSKYHTYDECNRSVKFKIDFAYCELSFALYLRQSMYGVSLQVNTDFKGMKKVEDSWKTFDVKSNETFDDFDIQKYFETRILPKYLYPEGLFRNIQIVNNCTKKEALEYYRKYISTSSTWIKEHTEEVNLYDVLTKRIAKKLNIEICSSFSIQKLQTILRTFDRQKKMTKMYKQPSFFEMSEEYHREHDTEDNIEEFVNNHFESNYAKNSMFV